MTIQSPHRDAQGRYAAEPGFQTINRYIRDPEFRAAMDAAKVREQMRLQIEMDRFALANFVGDDVPGWLCAARDRVSAYDGGEG